MTHGKPCVHMHANGHAYKWDVFIEEGGGSRKGKEKGRKGEKGKGEKKERKEKNKKEKKERKRKKVGGFFLSSLAFRWLELVGPRSKVRRLDEGLRFKR